MKKIALFSDGTGNSSASPQKTNVWRAYQALDRSPGSGQIAFYDNGVGTSPFRPLALLGLGFGFGLARNVREIYGFVCRTYDRGDEIYGFGFSRGAFTMRVVMALIANQGIIDRDRATDERDLERLIIYAYRQFRHENFTPSLLSFCLAPLRDGVAKGWRWLWGKDLYDPCKNIRYRDPPGDEPLIKFIGVWDTVDAYGLPVDELTRAWDRIVWPLSAKDRDLSCRIARARHALALDEQRESFEPLLWNEHNAPLGKTTDDEKLCQVWFAGVHSNVGGSYPDDSLALITLNWMLDESAKQNGLSFLASERQRLTEQATSNGPIYDSRKGVGTFYRYAPRNIEHLCHEKRPGIANWIKQILPSWLERILPKMVRERLHLSEIETNSVDVLKPKIHHSVFERIADSGDAYAPINLPEHYAVVDGNDRIVDMSSGSPQLPETRQEAADRRTRQAYVWNKVWAGKILYFVTLVIAILFVVYPRIRAAYATNSGEPSRWADAISTLIGTLGEPVRAIPRLVGQIPGLGFAASWAESYALLPYAFLAFVILLGALLWCSQYVGSRLRSEMRANWQPVSGDGPPPADLGTIGGFRTWLAGLLDGRPDAPGERVWSKGDWVAYAVRLIFEALGLLVLLTLVVAVISRLVLVSADGFGLVCKAERPGHRFEGPAEFEPQSFVLNPKSPCFDTGLEIEAGKHYAIEMEVSEDWSDADIHADVNGWRDEPLKSLNLKAPPAYMALFLPWRRHLFADWYQPIATVNEELFDRYPLEDQRDRDAEAEVVRQRTLSMTFKAKGSGRLYLYLNDGVVFLPGFLQDFYSNNNGCAWVTVTPLREGESADQPPRDDGQAAKAGEWRSCAAATGVVSQRDGS